MCRVVLCNLVNNEQQVVGEPPTIFESRNVRFRAFTCAIIAVGMEDFFAPLIIIR